MPILTIHGTADRSVPYGAGAEWADLLPEARLLTIEEGAHYPWIEVLRFSLVPSGYFSTTDGLQVWKRSSR